MRLFFFPMFQVREQTKAKLDAMAMHRGNHFLRQLNIEGTKKGKSYAVIRDKSKALM